MPNIRRLPGLNDGPEALLELAKVFGEQAVYDLIRLCRRSTNSGRDAGADAMTTLGNLMVAKEQNNANVDYDTARQNVATRLGYKTGGTRSNFYKILAGGRAPDPRRKVSAPR